MLTTSDKGEGRGESLESLLLYIAFSTQAFNDNLLLPEIIFNT